MLYPRKTVPFNTNEYRHGIDHVIPEETPGKFYSQLRFCVIIGPGTYA